MPKKKQQKSTDKVVKPKGVKKKNASLPRRPGGTKEGMFLSKVNIFPFWKKLFNYRKISHLAGHC